MARIKLGNQNKSSNKRESTGTLNGAKKVVQKFDKRRSLLREMVADWEENYPEASAALDSIKEIEDECVELIVEAKPLVAAVCKEAGGAISVGDFSAKYNKTSPSYHAGKLLEQLCKMAPAAAGKCLHLFYKRGLVTSLVVDRLVANVVHGTEAFTSVKTAWDKGGEAKSPSVSVPKL